MSGLTRGTVNPLREPSLLYRLCVSPFPSAEVKKRLLVADTLSVLSLTSESDSKHFHSGKPSHGPLRSGAARNNRNRIVLMGTIKRKSESC